MIEKTDICIIGGGIQGCATALELARRGAKVIVIERDYPGKQASGVNAGGVRRLNRDLAEVPLAMASHEIWCNIENHVGDDCGFTQSDNINIAETEEELAKITVRVRKLEELGFTHEQVFDKAAVQAHLPSLKIPVAGAHYCHGDGFASPFRTTQAFYKAAQTAGAKFFLGEGVTKLEKTRNWQVNTDKRSIEAKVVINCAGAWGNEIAKMVGDVQVVRAEAPMMSITEPIEPLTKSVVGFAGRRLSFKQRNNGTLLIGGGYRGVVNPDGKSARIDIKALTLNYQAVVDIFPQLASVKIIRCWAGVEGLTPDAIPIISPSASVDNLFHAFGFSSHGFQLGPIVGQIMADLAISNQTTLPIEPFSIRRFNC